MGNILSYSPIELLAIGGILLSGLVFLLYAKYKFDYNKTSLDGFLISNKDLSGKEFSNTFAAASVSLGGTIIFFIECHREYGILMALGPVFAVLVQFYLLKYFSTFADKVNTTEIRTVSDLWYKVFPSASMARGISIICIFTCMLGVAIELYMGSEILSYFLPSNDFSKALSFFTLGLLVIAYVRYGGYQAIIKTDTWQLGLLIAATVSMIVFAIKAPIVTPNTTNSDIIVELFNYSESGWPLFVFLAWACIINYCICFLDIAVWQRMAASNSTKESYKGLMTGIWKYIFVFIFPLCCFIIIYAKGHNYSTMTEFLSIIINQSPGISGYILFPLIVTGFTAALFSTADTGMIAAMYGLCDKNTFLPALQNITKAKQEIIIRKYVSLFSLFLVIFLSIFYYINSNEIQKYIMPIVYAVFGQMSMLAPLPIYALYRIKNDMPAITVSNTNNNVLMSSIALGCIIIWAGSYLEGQTGKQIWSHYAFLSSVIVMFLGVFIVAKLDRSKYSVTYNKYSYQS